MFKFILILIMALPTLAREARENEDAEKMKCVLQVADKCPDPRMAKDDIEMNAVFACRIKEINKCNKDNSNEAN